MQRVYVHCFVSLPHPHSFLVSINSPTTTIMNHATEPVSSPVQTITTIKSTTTLQVPTSAIVNHSLRGDLRTMNGGSCSVRLHRVVVEFHDETCSTQRLTQPNHSSSFGLHLRDWGTTSVTHELSQETFCVTTCESALTTPSTFEEQLEHNHSLCNGSCPAFQGPCGGAGVICNSCSQTLSTTRLFHAQGLTVGPMKPSTTQGCYCDTTRSQRQAPTTIDTTDCE